MGQDRKKGYVLTPFEVKVAMSRAGVYIRRSEWEIALSVMEELIEEKRNREGSVLGNGEGPRQVVSGT